MSKITRELAKRYDEAHEELQTAQATFGDVKFAIMEYCITHDLPYALELSPRWRRFVE